MLHKPTRYELMLLQHTNWKNIRGSEWREPNERIATDIRLVGNSMGG